MLAHVCVWFGFWSKILIFPKMLICVGHAELQENTCKNDAQWVQNNLIGSRRAAQKRLIKAMS